jgi:hypothetical protein
MSVIALFSANGAPGVSTDWLALGSVWPRRAVLAECDPVGGGIRAGYLQGRLPAQRGLLGWALSLRHDDAAGLADQLVDLDEGGQLAVLAGLADPAQLHLVARLWPRLAAELADLARGEPATDAIVDCGRLGAADGPEVIIAAADQLLLCTRPTLASLHATERRLALLRRSMDEAGGAGDRIGLVLRAGGPYRPAEIAAALGAPVLAVLPEDRAAAAVLAGEAAPGRGLGRRPLLRAARSLAETVYDRLRTQAPPGAPAPARSSGQDMAEARW